jgi:hypothetical protein
MEPGSRGQIAPPAWTDILAYLNLSSGAPDPNFRRHLDQACRWIDARQPAGDPWRVLPGLMRAELAELRRSSPAFAQADQVQTVIDLAFDRLLDAYRRWHRDLLFHQPDEALFRPFFLARACEAVLQQGGPWDQHDRIVQGALKRLNDFIGHRPVAVLHTAQKIEPYPHEWVAPVPLHMRGSGTALGPYHDLVEGALRVLADTEPGLLDEASFELESLEELSLDPRAYDFDHPVNKRPNYQFGQWDPHTIDNRGRYRRFVLQEVTLHALGARAAAPDEIPAEEALLEASIVLAGTMLMSSGTSGGGPEDHDSSVTLTTLLPRIARYRDVFYQFHLARIGGRHAERLKAEAARLRQPFGGARQHLNHSLSRLRATQLQHVCLAQLFARMGYPQASARQTAVVPVASARMLCEIDCRLAAGHHALDRADYQTAGRLLPEIDDLLRRGIGCGAIVDPWNILGFGGQFSLFPAPDNSIHDHRVDVLTHLMQRIFGLCSRVWRDSAAADDADLQARVRADMGELARWWDQFASAAVSSVTAVSGGEAWTSASQAAQALSAWRKAGEAAGDVAFWRRHVDEYTPPRAYASVVEALLDKQDYVSSMALLMQWLSQADFILLEEGDYSFHRLAVRWMQEVLARAAAADEPAAARQSWTQARKFFDYLEANAESYWQPPDFGWMTAGRSADDDQSPPPPGGIGGDDDEDDPLYSAAYEGVTFRDSTDDGIEGETLDLGPPTDFELDLEATRLERRLAFLGTVARLWKLVAATPPAPASHADDADVRQDAFAAWLSQATSNRDRLLGLLDAVHRFHVPEPTGAHDSLVEYDRRRMLKETVAERTIETCLETCDAARFIRAALPASGPASDTDRWERAAVPVLRATLRANATEVRTLFPELLAALGELPLLYLPLSRQGDPARIVATRNVLVVLRHLLRGLPRLGLLRESCQLIDAAGRSEQDHPQGPGAVTEFDRLFEVGCQSLVDSLVDISEGWDDRRQADSDLVDCLESLTQSLLKRWLRHSNNLRLSALERVADDEHWKGIVDFVERYGRDLFTPRFFNVGNMRAILHQGVEAYLRKLAEDGDPNGPIKLLDDLERDGQYEQTAARLQVIVEAVVENYAEFKDYNHTTTQSDRGELLHTFLDFLRLKASYERISWNLRPVVLAHDVLVRRGRAEAAELWRRALSERTADAAERHLKAVDELTRKHGMRLATVSDRMAERFVRPLAIARLRALVGPAIEEARQGRPPRSFEALEQECQEFTQSPVGAGLDVPDWLLALQQEALSAESASRNDGRALLDQRRLPQAALTLEEVQRQIHGW